jgi:hypothetical protein
VLARELRIIDVVAACAGNDAKEEDIHRIRMNVSWKLLKIASWKLS